MKEKIVGTRLGMAALDLRSWLDLRSLSFRNPEKAPMVANGLLADRLISHLPAEGSQFLDIGAHIGSVLSAVHYRNPSVAISAVEADAAKAAVLRARFPYCDLVNCAVGEESGTATFNIRDRSGYSSLVDQGDAAVQAVEVEVRRLDELFPDATFDVIKIDIEGAELGALRGGEALLKRSRPTIMFESAGLAENSLGYSAEKLWHWFAEAEFALFTPDRLAHDAPSLTLDAFLDAHEYPMRTHNYFAVATERRQEIRDKARRILDIGAG